jgi:hypothetical protein
VSCLFRRLLPVFPMAFFTEVVRDWASEVMRNKSRFVFPVQIS